MGRTRFADLIVGCCALCAIDRPMDIIHGTPVESGGVHLSLIHSEKSIRACF